MCIRDSAWNTFATGGVCPKCSKIWEYTQCYRCHNRYPHVDWYHDDPDVTEEIIEYEIVTATPLQTPVPQTSRSSRALPTGVHEACGLLSQRYSAIAKSAYSSSEDSRFSNWITPISSNLVRSQPSPASSNPSLRQFGTILLNSNR